MKKRNKKIFISLGIVFGIIVLLSGLKLSSNIVYFYTPDEAYALGNDIEGRVVRIGGMVQENTVTHNETSLELNFTLTDYKGHDILVSYIGSPPDLFKESQGVVAEGAYYHDEKRFKANTLMVKHSEEYQKVDSHHSIDKELLQKSLFK